MTSMQQQPPRKRRVWPIIVVLLMIVGCVGCGVVGLVSLSKSGAGSGSGSGGGRTFKIGDQASDGDLEFVVRKVDCTVGSVGQSMSKRTAQGVFCVVTLDVSNISKSAVSFLDMWQKGYDGSGREYSVDSVATLTLAPNTWVPQINPGVSIKGGVLVFDVPAGTTLTSIVLHDGPFSGGVRVQV